MKDQVKTVLANWIRQATSGIGTLPDGVEPSDWVADRFLAWWFDEATDSIEDSIGSAEDAAAAIRAELNRLGGWDKFGEALHELCHLDDSLSEIRQIMLKEEPQQRTELDKK